MKFKLNQKLGTSELWALDTSLEYLTNESNYCLWAELHNIDQINPELIRVKVFRNSLLMIT